jgi:hypothetical protein
MLIINKSEEGKFIDTADILELNRSKNNIREKS